jgi:hypothetical protein
MIRLGYVERTTSFRGLVKDITGWNLRGRDRVAARDERVPA